MAAHQAPRPWDSPGKNTGVGCHFLLQCMKVKSESEVSQSCPTLSDPMDCSLPGSSIHGIFQAWVLEWVAIAFSIPRATLIQKKKKKKELDSLKQIYCLMVLEARSLKLGFLRAMLPLKCVKESLLASWQLLVTGGHLWHSLVCRRVTAISALSSQGIFLVGLCFAGPSSYKDTPLLIQYDLIFTSAIAPFPSKIPFWSPGV